MNNKSASRQSGRTWKPGCGWCLVAGLIPGGFLGAVTLPRLLQLGGTRTDWIGTAATVSMLFVYWLFGALLAFLVALWIRRFRGQ